MKFETKVAATILILFAIAVGFAMRADGQQRIWAGGKLEGCTTFVDDANATINIGVRQLFTAANRAPVWDHAWKYCWLISLSSNDGMVWCTQLKYTSNLGVSPATVDTVRIGIYEPGGGFSDYVACDSMIITKVATDTIMVGGMRW